MIRRLAIALVTLALAACAGLIMQKPEVSLAGVELIDFGLFEQRFGLKLRIQNPNDAPLTIHGLTYEVEVNGRTFAKGVSDQGVTVPRFGEAVLQVSAVSTIGSLLRQLGRLQEREGLAYRLTGRVHTGALGSLPFEHTGQVRLPELPFERREQPRPDAT